ncbi:RagB/SusD family nutrient uptake outer membrane protein [Parapedobacter deserti]|uniref:RagB/SusD family nutrient uptake outer membrane protein n=1 Tax=Parapedobacter deserti TaxID=1912957 RepID=A0ABV7JGA8_9SPHI
MKTNYFQNIGIGLVLACLLAACTKLDMQVSGVINPTDFPKTERDVEALVVSCYVPFRSNWYNGIFTVNNDGYQVIGDMSTDIGDCLWDNGMWNAAIYQNWNPETVLVTKFYDYLRDLNRFTMVLDLLERADINADRKSQAIAEVKAARGFMGYLLYSWFGPVPVAHIDQLQDPLSTDVIPRPTDEDMVAHIERDLQEAAAVLPYSYDNSDYGRFTKGLVNTLILKLYMLESRWDDAVSMGRELTDARYNYGLVNSSYADIFTYENQRNREIIFAATCDRTNAQLWLAHVLPGSYPTDNPNIVKWNGYRVPWRFYETFDPTDQRLNVLVGSYHGTDGVQYSKSNPGNALTRGAIPVKYGEDPGAIGEDSSIDWIVYRYADVLTLLAEAIVRSEGIVTDEAVQLLNQIRVRAGIDPYELSRYATSGVQGFLDDILLERGHEFWFEGLRREDLIRHGKYRAYALEKGSTTAQEWFTRMPLPQRVIIEGKGKIHQNSNY